MFIAKALDETQNKVRIVVITMNWSANNRIARK